MWRRSTMLCLGLAMATGLLLTAGCTPPLDSSWSSSSTDAGRIVIRRGGIASPNSTMPPNTTAPPIRVFPRTDTPNATAVR